MNPCLLTGGLGFLGRHVSACTECLVWDTASESPVNLRHPPPFPAHCRGVVHLAAVSNDAACRTNPASAWDINITATVQLYLAAAAAGAEFFVLASSEWVYPDSPHSHREDSPLVPATLGTYGLTKWASELALARIAVESCPLVILRLGILYGPRRPPVAAPEKVVAAVVADEPLTVGSKLTGRSFLHVEDAAAAIAAVVASPVPGTYNLGGEPLSLDKIHVIACEASGQTPVLSESSPSTPSQRFIDSTRFRSTFSWSPTSLADRIHSLVATYGTA